MRTIDADALYKFIQDQMEKETGAYTRGKNKAFNIVKSALHNECATPTIDAVPVVRCKDCRYQATDKIFGNCWCNHDLGVKKVKPDDFCSYGKRKDGDQNES